jgi:hypothetical protein
MHQLAHAVPHPNRAADIGKVFEEVNMVEYGIAKLLGVCGKVCSGIGEDVREIH